MDKANKFNSEVRKALSTDTVPFMSAGSSVISSATSTASVATSKLSEKEKLFKKFTKLSIAQRALHADPGAKPAIRGVVSLSISNLSFENLNEPVYLEVVNGTTTKRSDYFEPSRNGDIDQKMFKKRIQVAVPKSARHSYNLLSINVKSNNPSSGREVKYGSVGFHLHDIISMKVFSGVFDIADEFNTIGTMNLDVTFNYGIFGFGYSHQLQEDTVKPEDMVAFSLFPRILPVEGEEQEEGTLDIKEAQRPKHIPRFETTPDSEQDNEELSENEDDSKPDYSDMKQYHDRYMHMEDRVSRIFSLCERIASRHNQKPVAAFRSDDMVQVTKATHRMFVPLAQKLAKRREEAEMLLGKEAST